jgi:hypothetical protein
VYVAPVSGVCVRVYVPGVRVYVPGVRVYVPGVRMYVPGGPVHVPGVCLVCALRGFLVRCYL